MATQTPERTMNSQISIYSLENLDQSKKNKVLSELEGVEKSAWPDDLIASSDKFSSRIEIFPEGFFVAEVDGVIKGMSTSQVTNYDSNVTMSWDELTDNGYIKKSHNLSGNAIYVVSVAVAADAQGLGLGSKLVEEQKKLSQKLGKKYLFLGARIPGYDEYCRKHGDLSVEEYLQKRTEKGETIDPEIRFYERRGLRVAKITNAFEPDPPSRDYGVVMLWENSNQ